MAIYSFQVHDEHSKNLFSEQVKTIGFWMLGLAADYLQNGLKLLFICVRK